MDCESMDCKKIKEELVFVYVDDEMGQELLIAFRSHVSKCPHCAQEVEHTEQLMTVVRKMPRQVAPPNLRDRILSGLPPRAKDRRTIPVG